MAFNGCCGVENGRANALFHQIPCDIEPQTPLTQTTIEAPPRHRTAAMKEGIHPNYHKIKVVMTDGTEYETRSTYGKDGDTLHLDIDSKSHPAWTGGQQQIVDRGGRVSRFQKKFSGLLKKE
jgi:large subunit ribosomal protein L31